MKKKKPRDGEKKDSNIVESIREQEVTFICPKRGRVTERVKIKRFKPQTVPDKQITYELDILNTEPTSDE